MTPTLEDLKTTVSALPISDRAALAHYLLETLDSPDEGVAEAWREELARRMADIRSGKAVGKPIEQVLARLRELYP